MKINDILKCSAVCLAMFFQACAPSFQGPNPSLRADYMRQGQTVLPDFSDWKLEREVGLDALANVPGEETLLKRYDSEDTSIVVSYFKARPEQPYMFSVYEKTPSGTVLTFFVDNDADGDFETIKGPKDNFPINFSAYLK